MNQGASTNIPTHTIQSKAGDFPDALRHIPDPPGQLYVCSQHWRGLLTRPWVAIVGSRNPTSYGQAVTNRLAGELAQAGLVIVSGLALGIDGAAHRGALEAGGLTVAVLAGGLNRVYPSRHQALARAILQQGGALVSEYPDHTTHYPQHFIARNRLVAGLSQAIIITEAAEKSGTLHTVRFALEQGREVLAVPGNITSPASVATNRLIKSGATPITGTNDVLQVLGLRAIQNRQPAGATPTEQVILDILAEHSSADSHTLLAMSKLEVSTFNQTLTMLEITAKIRPLGNNQWTING